MLLTLKHQNYYLKKINIVLTNKYIFNENDAHMFIINEIIVELKAIFLSDEDVVIKNNLIFLEKITGQKAVALGEFKYIGSTKKFFFEGYVTLRKKKLNYFLLFFTICCLATYYKRNGLVIDKVKAKEYILQILDYNIFPTFNFLNLTGTLLVKFFGNKTTSSLKVEDCLRFIKVK